MSLVAVLLMMVGIILLVMLGVIVYAGITARREIDNLKTTAGEVNDAFQDFFKPHGEDHLSDFQRLVGNMSIALSAEIASKTLAAFHGSIGGTIKGLNHELEEEAVKANPSLALLKALPKSTQKNPLAMAGIQIFGDRIVAALSNMGNPGKDTTSTGNGHKQQSFNL